MIWHYRGHGLRHWALGLDAEFSSGEGRVIVVCISIIVIFNLYFLLILLLSCFSCLLI